jgi:hypothetical protein
MVIFFAVDEIDHSGELSLDVLMTNTWFDVINLEGGTNSKNIKNVVPGLLRHVYWEYGVFFSVTDHESHVVAPVGSVLLSLGISMTGHVKERWQREAII